MEIGDVQEIANELFDGDSARFNELMQGVNAKFERLEKLESLCKDMVEKPPGKVYFNPWAEKLKAFGIVKSTKCGKSGATEISIVEKLRNLRAARKAKLEEVAKVINVSRGEYFAIEKGLLTANSDQLASLAKFYGVKSITS